MALSTFESLPSDIISLVFETGCALEGGPHIASVPFKVSFALLLSQLSPSLRAIALSTPRLWAVLHGRMPIDQVDAFAARSGNCSLTVFLWEYKPPAATPVAVQAICAHSARWERISVIFGSSVPLPVASTMFPMLKEFEVRDTWVPRHGTPAVSLRPSAWEDSIPGWTMPILTSYKAYMGIPVKLDISSVRSLELSQAYYKGHGEAHVRNLHRVLTGCKDLEYLVLKLRGSFPAPSPDASPAPLLPPINLPKVKSFSYEQQVSETMDATIYTLLHMPALETLCINTKTTNPELSKYRACTNLTNVDITCGSVDFAEIFDIFPNLRHLTFRGGFISQDHDHDAEDEDEDEGSEVVWLVPTSLTSINLRGCYMPRVAWLLDFLSALRSSTVWTTFKGHNITYPMSCNLTPEEKEDLLAAGEGKLSLSPLPRGGLWG